MNQKIYNALRELEGHVTLDAGNGFVYDVWLTWGDQPYQDLTRYDQNEDLSANFQFKHVFNKPLFNLTNGAEGSKQIVIGLDSIIQIN